MPPTSLSTPALFPSQSLITGQHITLEALAPSHIPTLWSSIGNNSSLWMQIPSGPFSSLEDFTRYIHARIACHATDPRWSVRLSTPYPNTTVPNYIGLVGLGEINLEHRTIEIGPVIYGSSLQRTRAGTEVMLLMGDVIFDKCAFRRWEWRCNALNVASRRAAERYGFVLEGVLRQHQIVRGANRDTCVFSMVGGEWEVGRRVWEAWMNEANFEESGGMRKAMGVVRQEVLAETRGKKMSG